MIYMRTILLHKSKISENSQNPRTISDEKLGKLIQSLLDFPEMLFIRPITIGTDGMSLGGNMRYRAINEIRDYTDEYKKSILEGQTEKRKDQTKEQQGEFEEAINHLLFDDTFHVIDVSFLSKEKQEEFIIKDNIGYGDWDWPVLDNLWGKQTVESWGLEVPNWTEEKKDENKEKEITPDDLDTNHECPKCGYEF